MWVLYHVMESAERSRLLKISFLFEIHSLLLRRNVIYPLSLGGLLWCCYQSVGAYCESVCVCGKGLIVFLFFWIRSITCGDRNPDSSRRSADGLSGDRSGRWSLTRQNCSLYHFPQVINVFSIISIVNAVRGTVKTTYIVLQGGPAPAWLDYLSPCLSS